MDAVKITDAGSHLVITGVDLETVEAAMAELVSKGARAAGKPERLGSKWIASCEKPLQDVATSAPPASSEDSEDAAALRALKVANAGSHLILTATDRRALERALHHYVKRGARVISAIAPLGNRWVATCANPEEIDESCTIEHLGYQIVVTGSTERAVRQKVESLAIGGAKVIAPIDRIGEKWVAVCDTRG